MQSQQHTSAPAACCRVWGAGWERLHLGKMGELQTGSMHIH